MVSEEISGLRLYYLRIYRLPLISGGRNPCIDTGLMFRTFMSSVLPHGEASGIETERSAAPPAAPGQSIRPDWGPQAHPQ